MKNRISIALSQLSFILILFSCQKGDINPPFITNGSNSPNGFLISGDGYANQSFTMNSISKNKGYYDTTKHQSIVVAEADSDTTFAELSLFFSGNGITPVIQFSLISSTDTSVVVKINKKGQKSIYSSIPKLSYFKVTRYDGINGKIEGAYYGSFVNQSNISDTVGIINGRFSVLRLPDVH